MEHSFPDDQRDDANISMPLTQYPTPPLGASCLFFCALNVSALCCHWGKTGGQDLVDLCLLGSKKAPGCFCFRKVIAWHMFAGAGQLPGLQQAAHAATGTTLSRQHSNPTIYQGACFLCTDSGSLVLSLVRACVWGGVGRWGGGGDGGTGPC